MTDANCTVRTATGRPRSIVWFEWLMYLDLVGGFAFGTVHNHARRDALIAQHGLFFYALVLIVVCGLYVLAIWSIARRRKSWVRWVFVVTLIIGLPKAVPDMIQNYQTDPAAHIAEAVDYLILCLALCLVFTTEARAWFRGKPAINPAVFD